ncbi:aminopeptidase N [Brevibacterium senegalense]|uniref:aminopeptidase N n=1 Tax=Brevibacterium senegalense TaxID=1033736 RepID=UPI000308DC28|nr:aminopeptidase N [Brevibacterium senegalense]
MPQHNLTRAEAQERAAALEVRSYDITLVLDGTGPTFRSVTTVSFTSTTGEGTFLDAICDSVDRLVLNGEELDPAAHVQDGRIALTHLAQDNVVTVDGRFTYMNTGEGLHRFVDPVDDETYLYTQFEVPDSRRVFAVFEQPDLKASFTFTVLAPSHWTVVSNSPAPQAVEASGHPDAAALGIPGTGLSVWQFAPTARISSYITAIVAGPYSSVHSTLTSSDGTEVPLGLYCRASLAQHLDADDLFDLTRAGFEFFESRFGVAYPFEKYDQLFVPEFNAGAMENAGAVTFLEDYVFRSRPTQAMVERRAITVLHELAHMWFGDLVTMRWWNDLWLNESFAEFMSTLAAAEATRFTDAWTTFATLEKSWAYRQDQLPSTHPIVAQIEDLEDVEVNFDGITYAKGAAVLRALVAYVGPHEFFAGLQSYFHTHAWSNTELDDLLRPLEAVSGRDLRAWSKLWLEESGVNVIRALPERDGSGALTSVTLTQEPHIIPGQPVPSLRPHRLAVGFYGLDDADRLVRLAHVETDLDGESVQVPVPQEATAAEVVVPNDGDLTYAKVRLDEGSHAVVARYLSGFDDSLTQLLVLSSLWDAVRDGEQAASDYIRLLLDHLPALTHSSGLLVQLRQLATALTTYVPPERRGALRAQVADRLWDLANGGVPAGSDQQLQLFQAFCLHACTQEHADRLEQVLDRGTLGEGLGLDIDTDLGWTIVAALASLDRWSDERIAAHLRTDGTAAGQRAAATARAARPTSKAKTRAFVDLVEDRSLPNAMIGAISRGFARGLEGDDGRLIPAADPLTDFGREYFDRVTGWWESRTLEVAQTLTLALHPPASERSVRATEAWIESHPKAPKGLVRLMRENLDTSLRALRAQATDAAQSEVPGAHSEAADQASSQDREGV